MIDTRRADPKRLLKEIAKKQIIGHNLKFDYRVLRKNYDIRIENLFDTMLAAQIVECGMDKEEIKGWFGLESCAKRYANKDYYSKQGNLFAPTIPKKLRDSFLTMDSEPFNQAQLYYGGIDIVSTFVLYEVLQARIKQDDLTETLRIENEFLKVFGDMEEVGVRVDPDQWLENYRHTLKKTEDLEKELMSFRLINWKSPKQVVPILKELGVDTNIIDKKTGNIKDSAAAGVLERHISTHPIIPKLIEFNLSRKESSTYGLKFLQHIDPETNRVHSSFMQILRTGRTSSTNPNIQNIKRGAVYRSAFQPEEGNVFVAADFSNIEARILAEKCGDENFLSTFENGGDYHTATARIAFNDPTLTKDSHERQIAKNINFSLA